MLTLAANELPALLEPALRQEIAAIGLRKQVVGGTLLLNLDEVITYLPIVLQGRLQVKMYNAQGNELLLYDIVQPETCMMTLQAVMSGQHSHIKAVAEEDSTFILLPVGAVRTWLDCYPSWARFVLQLYYTRFREMAQVVEALAFHNTSARLWQLLQQHAGAHATTEIVITHQQLADELGTAREVVSRLLKGLEGQGKLALARGRIKILAIG